MLSMIKAGLQWALILLALQVNIILFAQPTNQLFSPDKKLFIRFETGKAGEAGQLYYSVSFNGKWLLLPSALKLQLNGFKPLGDSVVITNTVPSAVDDSYQLLVGKASKVRNQYNALTLQLEEPGGAKRQLQLEARAYNDAVAFRYVVPEQPATSNGYQLQNEFTQFHFSTDATTFPMLSRSRSANP